MPLVNTAAQAWLPKTMNLDIDHANYMYGTLADASLAQAGQSVQNIYPGMVMSLVGNRQFAVYDGTGLPIGLSTMYRTPNLNEVGENGFFSVAIGGPSTQVTVSKMVLDSSAVFTVPSTGDAAYVYATSTGLLSNTGTVAVGRLVSVNADGGITFNLMEPADMASSTSSTSSTTSGSTSGSTSAAFRMPTSTSSSTSESDK
ncbi:MAG: hypothetical protein IIT36_00710 [Aeriscardovia sp.]|nr:hypothetical protein [Aeriscardovia sp.]